jgi:hypothetical protein
MFHHILDTHKRAREAVPGPKCNICNSAIPCNHYKFQVITNPEETIIELNNIENEHISKLRRLNSRIMMK